MQVIQGKHECEGSLTDFGDLAHQLSVNNCSAVKSILENAESIKAMHQITSIQDIRKGFDGKEESYSNLDRFIYEYENNFEGMNEDEIYIRFPWIVLPYLFGSREAAEMILTYMKQHKWFLREGFEFSVGFVDNIIDEEDFCCGELYDYGDFEEFITFHDERLGWNLKESVFELMKRT